MGITNFPNGILATPNLGGNEEYASWFGTNTYYVDGDNGNNSNDGSMTHPFKTIQAGINASGTQDTVYVRTKAPSADASEPGTYVEDLTIPYANHGMRLIGVSSNYGVWGGPKVKNASAVDLLTVRASNVTIKNFSFNCTRASGLAGIKLTGSTGYSTDAGAVGTTIQNCFIKNASAAYGGIYIDGGYGCVVRGCVFQFTVRGVWVSGMLYPNSAHRIVDCDFLASAGTAVAEHIFVEGACSDVVIRDSTFAAATNFIEWFGSANGMMFNCGFNDNSSAVLAASGAGKILIPAGQDNVGAASCWGGDGTAVDASGT